MIDYSNLKLYELDELAPEEAYSILTTKLAEIERKLKKSDLNLSVNVAVNMFGEYLKSKKGTRGYKYVLLTFTSEFSDKKMAEITTEDIEELFFKYWPNATNNTLRTRRAQLNGLFNFAIRLSKEKGMPLFHNPISLFENPEYGFDK